MRTLFLTFNENTVSLDCTKPRFLTPLVATAHTVFSEDAESRKAPEHQSNQTSGCDFRHGDTHLNIDAADALVEPPSVAPSSLLSGFDGDGFGIAVPDTTSDSASGRSLARKKLFNTLSAKRSSEPRFKTNKVYTFEFYQHLLDFGDELAVDMGRIGGMIPLAHAMDGQPLKIMAAYRNDKTKQELEPLWSFDIFHESLYSYAKRALD